MTTKNNILKVFFLDQMREIQRGGVRVIVRKFLFVASYCLSQILSILLFLVAYPVIFIEEFLERWIDIPYIGEIRTDRFGEFALPTELVLCARDMDPVKRKKKYVFFFGPNPCNLQLLKMWSRILTINPWAKILHRINSRVLRGRKYVINMIEFNYDSYPLIFSSPHLSFTQDEEKMGKQKLLEMGVPDRASFICFHARDSAYLESRKSDGYHVTQDWYYATYRDVNIDNLLPAIEDLANKGYYLIRMGAAVEKPLNSNNPKIIDYATKFRSDFMDVYLGAKCTFALVGGSGIATIPMIFRRPVAFHNYIPIGHAQVCQDNFLWIPKKLWQKKDHRQMTISEIFNSGAAWYEFRELYDKDGIVLIENTADEIRSLAIEMESRITGTWINNEEDDRLQEKFWELFNLEGPYHREVHKIVNARVSADYLRKNKDLLK